MVVSVLSYYISLIDSEWKNSLEIHRITACPYSPSVSLKADLILSWSKVTIYFCTVFRNSKTSEIVYWDLCYLEWNSWSPQLKLGLYPGNSFRIRDLIELGTYRACQVEEALREVRKVAVFKNVEKSRQWVQSQSMWKNHP